ncbi:lytic polysaccharide monooxygenase [Conexibacter sp. CPCC 206217]|uniref:lytic polysaccharide monooxygenase n=1 Tax=Conexibacter sp. CPCC 206217 TaxID=3064574 RepID=UPI00271D8A6B|nr:lytic polysaccharide monooxygenase [Conexibacter sp. CPCC 206217]MDO8210663.1 lytic polysaccharide monooxygenase [Conexibacter sp. CPCC 206217]
MTRRSTFLRTFATTVALVTLGAGQAHAHGTTYFPASRTYACRYVDRTPGPCANAWRSNPQALYDWMALLISNADGRHRELIPNGKLCSAGDPKYAAFDKPSAAWPATGVRAGPQTIRYVLNAPHATLYYRFYLTKQGFDPATQALGWGDLELIHDSGRRPAATMESFQVDLPQRSGRQILYVIWQRSDSPEAFYACSDLIFGAPGTLPLAPPMPDEMAGQPGAGGGGHTGHGGHGGGRGMPRTAPSSPLRLSGRGISMRRRIDDDWSTGYCATVTVRNRSKRSRAWRATMRMPDRIDTIWDAVAARDGGRLSVRGKPYNRTLRPGGSTSFGYCATR